jgi:hypothetical protein
MKQEQIMKQLEEFGKTARNLARNPLGIAVPLTSSVRHTVSSLMFYFRAFC